MKIMIFKALVATGTGFEAIENVDEKGKLPWWTFERDLEGLAESVCKKARQRIELDMPIFGADLEFPRTPNAFLNFGSDDLRLPLSDNEILEFWHHVKKYSEKHRDRD